MAQVSLETLEGHYLYVKSKSTLSQWVTRSPIELLQTAKKRKTGGYSNSPSPPDWIEYTSRASGWEYINIVGDNYLISKILYAASVNNGRNAFIKIIAKMTYLFLQYCDTTSQK